MLQIQNERFNTMLFNSHDFIRNLLKNEAIIISEYY